MRKKRVLVIEDNVSIRLLLKNILNKAGLEVLEAENGVVGGRVFMSTPDIDLVILDLMMPLMNGHQFLKSWGKEVLKREVPICVLSALDDHNTVLDAITKGATDYAIKPIDKDLLLTKVNELLGGSKQSFSKIRAKFDVVIKGIDEKLPSFFLSENSLLIITDNIKELPPAGVIQNCYLNKLSNDQEGIIVRIGKPVNVDGSFIVEMKFVGLKESKSR